ncbi:MAG TPA: DUF2161 family putative PD-(D/E)XK-type phosphodiesterase [Pseudobacteroides sp.]|uniref:DUF2161 family putative PD-(D/E)XK-type phosphodiesterase n=1 Tax=Pseudobacteroides sp. TaxID=1968840 RepID=UPI002F95F915
MGKDFLEIDLYKPIHDLFVKEGYEVRSEAHYCDICATKDEQLTIIELKRNLSVELLAQAVKRQKLGDFVYIAVPKPKKLIGTSKWKDICNLIKRLELGLILVSLEGKNLVEIPISPKPFDFQASRQKSKDKRLKLVEELKGRTMELNVGGSRGKKLVTAYKENSLHIACCLNMFGPMTAKKITQYGTDPNKTWSILNRNFYGWFYKHEKSVYGLSDAGKRALDEYPELAEHYKNKILYNDQ